MPPSSEPLAIDLYAGLGGWTEGLLAEGYRVVGFDNERHVYGAARYPATLVIQDVLTLHGAQFKNAALIVASPPCQEFSYMAMPWTRAKAKAARLRSGEDDPKRLTALFDACFRIQAEAITAAWHHIPLVVENVCGAQKWVGRARWHYGSFYLWGDVPALMPITRYRGKGPKVGTGDQFCAIRLDQIRDDGEKVPGFRFDGSGRSFQSEGVKHSGARLERVSPRFNRDGVDGVKVASDTGRRTDIGKGALFTSQDCGVEASGIKQGGDWFNASQPSISRLSGSKSTARKAASAHIAKIPLALARHIARAWYPI